MATKAQVFDNLLNFASTSRSRSMVTLAAVSFAICHLVFLASAPASAGAADLDAEIPRQLVRFAAEFCRFALPLGFMIAGFAIRAKSERIARPKKSVSEFDAR
jgi:hypothetical protein